MQEDGALIERRKQKRCYLQGDGVAVALLKSPEGKSTVVGEIIDISPGGAAFRYISAQPASDAPSELSLVSADHSFYLGNLPITTVSDLEQAKIPFGGISTRRRGVKFGILRQSQQFALQHFIRNYTVGENETY